MISEKSKRLAILVYSCEKNNDMWTIFIRLFKKYWGDCPYNIFLLTDKCGDISKADGFDDIIIKDSSWYDMINAGIDRAGTPFISLWMDDYLLCDYVKSDDVEKIMNHAEEYKAANIRLYESDMIKAEPFVKNTSYSLYKPGSAYSFTTQVGIWNTKCLKSYLNPKWSAWDFERVGSVTIVDKKHPLLGTRDYFFPYIEGVRKGKWMREGASLCQHAGIKLDYNIRPQMSDWEMAKIYIKSAIIRINPTLVQKMQNIWNKMIKK